MVDLVTTTFSSIAIIAVLFSLSIFREPTWLKDGSLAPSWFKINISGSILGVIFSIIANLIYSDYILLFKVHLSFSVAALTFCFTQFLFTDFQQRKADNRILYISILFTVISGFLLLHLYSNEENKVVYIVIFLAAFITMFISGIGPSDGRALALCAATLYPISGPSGIQLSMILFLPLLFAYFIYLAVKNKSIKKTFTKRLSFPAVPFILLPAIITVLIYPVLFA